MQDTPRDPATPDHRQVTARLGGETLARLNRTADGPGLRHLAGHGALIFGLGLWIALGWPLWWALLPIQGIALCFLFTLEHEATHKTPFATPWLNEAAGHVSGLLILLPFTWFRYFHLAHHRHTNDPERDPELLSGAKPESWPAYLWHVSGLPYWGGMVAQILHNALDRAPAPYIPARARPRIRREARVMLLLYALAGASLLASPLLFWVWIVPLLLGQPALRLYLLAEHGRCAFVANMLENTRTTYTNRAVRLLAWNMPYHIEHHSLPNVPFHKLPELNRLMAEDLRETAQGYARFTRDYTGTFGDQSR
ncbi:fatty acid desaturase [Roseovarius sp. C7]|uniref:fatty acid desaturase n=1 Tax=Roseovarius sp. C7 TaxID=3398643 RepID=UPI0039F6E035